MNERTIIAIEDEDIHIVVTLSCGHTFRWEQKWTFTAKQWADMLRKHWIGESWPCAVCKSLEAMP